MTRELTQPEAGLARRASRSKPSVAIACGGTGGHVFPGLAVADQLVQAGCDVRLLISTKEVDQQAVENASGMEIITLPAVGLTRGARISFLRGFIRSYRTAKQSFRARPPQAALAMGGFTSAPPLLAAKRLGAQTYLHESNAIPGRANRWLSHIVSRAFVGFPCAGKHLGNRNLLVTGTPVRPAFQAQDARACRASLGLEPARPVVLVMGGSQGASGINQLVAQSLPLFAEFAPEAQWLHLTGKNDLAQVKQAYAGLKLRAVVHSFFAEMELALGAAAAAISRAGASSLAEFAAMRVPALLIPYPGATDNHQFANARAFEETGAARLLEQKDAVPQKLAHLLLPLLQNPAEKEKMQRALAQWHAPHAAQLIAHTILSAVTELKLSPRPEPPLRESGSSTLTRQTAHVA